jgi:ribosomal protein L29
MSDETPRLSEVEIRQYEEASWKLQKLHLELQLKQLEQQLHQSAQESIKLKIQIVTRGIGDKTNDIKNHRQSHSDYNNKVCERLGLEAGMRFAYDPYTGEIEIIHEGE